MEFPEWQSFEQQISIQQIFNTFTFWAYPKPGTQEQWRDIIHEQPLTASTCESVGDMNLHPTTTLEPSVCIGFPGMVGLKKSQNDEQFEQKYILYIYLP